MENCLLDNWLSCDSQWDIEQAQRRSHPSHWLFRASCERDRINCCQSTQSDFLGNSLGDKNVRGTRKQTNFLAFLNLIILNGIVPLLPSFFLCASLMCNEILLIFADGASLDVHLEIRGANCYDSLKKMFSKNFAQCKKIKQIPVQFARRNLQGCSKPFKSALVLRRKLFLSCRFGCVH